MNLLYLPCLLYGQKGYDHQIISDKYLIKKYLYGLYNLLHLKYSKGNKRRRIDREQDRDHTILYTALHRGQYLA